MTEPEPVVELIVDEPGWQARLPDLAEIAEAAARAALDATGLAPAGMTIALLACDDAGIALLNARFRGRDRPTNVLSWPAYDLGPGAPGARPPAPPEHAEHLGDVAIALQTTMREADERGISLKSHATHLILHGCLHLLGYDHDRAEDADLMEGIETRTLIRLGIADPYLIVDPGAAAPHPER
ncbi:MAG TPA: rRNA maturation RNase YbeY [Thermohalobaculum sp.]|nr:rRNA maturation RNase YbeY [Thermohalobaculum sp.]